MIATAGDPGKREALDRLRASVERFAAASASLRETADENDRLLSECRAAVRLVEDLLLLLEHHVRGPLTVVKGRAQLLQRQARAAPQPDVQLIAGLAEIDTAVNRIVAHLDRLLDEPDGAAGDARSPFDTRGV
jgi:nitrogen-specific signal transduction histidine kinase